jgi:hypothetical protein
MNPFARFALFTVARDAAFVTLAAMILMLAFSFRPELALEIGATVALIFSVCLLVRVSLLTEERLERCEVWRALPEEERPPGEDGRRWARGHFELLLLHFAKGASGFAGVLYVGALLMALASGLAPPFADASSSHQFVNAARADIAIR